MVVQVVENTLLFVKIGNIFWTLVLYSRAAFSTVSAAPPTSGSDRSRGCRGASQPLFSCSTSYRNQGVVSGCRCLVTLAEEGNCTGRRTAASGRPRKLASVPLLNSEVDAAGRWILRIR